MSKAPLAPLKTTGPQSKSAWSNGPPRDISASSTPRSQSPAPSSPAVTTHSRRPSALSGAGYNARTNRGSIVGKTDSQSSASTVKDQGPAPVSTSTQNQQNAPALKNETRSLTFGTITDKPPTTTNGKPAPPSSAPPPTISATAPSTSTAPSSTAAQSSSSSTSTKPKVDVRSFFRANTADNVPSPGPSSFAETVASPSVRPNVLPVPSHTPFPGPNQHGQGPQGHVSQHMYGQPNQQQPFRPGSAAPRSPSFTRQMPNGAPGVRPHVQSGPPAPGAVMSSPRLSAAVPHPHPPHPPHQPPQQPQAQMPVTPGQPMPQMQQQHMQAYPSWPGYYYPYMQGVPGMPIPQDYGYAWVQTPQTPHGAPAQLAHQPPHAPHGVPVSPRLPQQTLHQPPLPPQQRPPGTPPAGVASALPPQPRLNSSASAFVPSSGNRRVKITDESGHTVDFTKQHGSAASSGTPSPVPFQRSQRTPVRMESEEARRKREEEERRSKREHEEKERREKEKEAREREEAARARKAKEEQERKKAQEEKAKKEEEEKKKREEEERRRREEEERKKKEEEERIRKEEEEKERLRKEEEERIRKEKEEEERKRKEEEEERKRKEDEERIRREEEERRRKEEVERERAEAAAKAKAEEERKAAAEAEAKAKAEKEKELTNVINAAMASAPISASPESHKKRPVPGPLDLSAAQRANVSQPLPSALATARHISDLGQITYPSGIMSPKPELNKDAKDGKFRYDREFLLQFMSVCKEKPDNMPRLDALGLEAVEPSHAMGRSGSGRRGVPGGMGGSASRSASVGLGISPGGGQSYGKSMPSGFVMGNFSTTKMSSEERFIRSSSLSMGPSNTAMQYAASRATQMVRSSSQGGPGGIGAQGNKRSRSQRGKHRGEQPFPSQPPSALAQPLEPVAPLEQSANRWVAASTSRINKQPDQQSPEVVDRKVRALLNKLTMEKFDSISGQIIDWANKSVDEKDGRTLIQVIRLVFEKATDEATWSEMYARLCRKMMEQISPDVQDDGIRNAEGKPITGGQLFRKYLLNRCQEDFERGWSQKEAAAEAAASKAAEDRATKEANEKTASGEEALYSDEYYAAQKAKRQGLGLVKFIGELFKLQMLTERIMHECIKKLLSNVDNPEEEEIESLCKLLTTVGSQLDSSKARGHIDIYFSRMKELAKSGNVSSRMQFMLLDVIELRERKWIPRGQQLAGGPKTLAQVHEDAAKEKQEKEALTRTMGMSRGGSRRGTERSDPANQPNADGWSTAGSAARQQAKAGDLSNFGKIQKSGGSQMSFAPTSVFSKGSKRDSSTLARTSSNSNMFSALSQNPEAVNEIPATAPRSSRPPSRLASMDITPSTTEPGPPSATGRPKLQLLPRTKPLPVKTDEQPLSAVPKSDDEKEQEPYMSEADALKKIGNDVKEFFAIRSKEEAEDYFTKLPKAHLHLLVEKLVSFALESKEADATLVGDLFKHVKERDLCTVSAFEEGFLSVAEFLDDIAIDAPKACDFMAAMVKGAGFGDDSKNKIASKSTENKAKLLEQLK